MNDVLKKILVVNTMSEPNIEFIAYLIEDQATKFITLNESKRITLHYPKCSYFYKFIKEEK